MDTTLPLIEVELSKERKVMHAFLDTGADDNTISYEVFACLNDVKLEGSGCMQELECKRRRWQEEKQDLCGWGNLTYCV